MSNIAFIADFFATDINGGGESNDSNLIKHLSTKNSVSQIHSHTVQIEQLKDYDCFVIGNFVRLSEEVKNYLAQNKKYVIYEHDHKYIDTRDPSKFKDFVAPKNHIINESFYTNAHKVVVLSKICKEVLVKNIPNADVHSIGCSLWSEDRIALLRSLSSNEKTKSLCILNSSNPTKNTPSTVRYCENNNMSFEAIHDPDPRSFLVQMSQFEKFLFIPTVLETFSRVCAEAKMMNLQVLTNRKLIGFFSEEISSYTGEQLINELYLRNQKALSFFDEVVK